ncbi:MAG: efflux RND transporter periplasmic adaptor subunit [Chitinophagales bacterium]
MKKILIYTFAISVLASCGSSKSDTDKQAQLDALKKERASIDNKIKNLEQEIALEGGASAGGKKMLVNVQEAAPQPFTHYIEVQAQVDANENVLVTAQMPGVVKRVYVTEGQAVSNGQLLAELDNEAAKKNVETMETQLSFAKDLYNKQKALWDQQIGSEVQYLSAKNNVETLEKSLAAAKEQLEMSKLLSPINGVVDAVDIKAGQIASPGMMGIRVVNMSSLKVKAEVSETHSASVRTGNKAIIYFPDLKKEEKSSISFTSKVINPQSRTFTTEAKISSDGVYKPNMIAVLKIADYENAAAYLVDVNLVQQSSEATFIYIAEEKEGKLIAARRTVTVGRIYGGKAEITSGISPGDKIITTGYMDLVNGQEIIL